MGMSSTLGGILFPVLSPGEFHISPGSGGYQPFGLRNQLLRGADGASASVWPAHH